MLGLLFGIHITRRWRDLTHTGPVNTGMNNKLLRILPFAGTIPFVAGAALLLTGNQALPFIGSTERAILSYGLLILSFMAGVHWGQYLSGVRTSVDLLLTSNVITLATWFGFLLLPAQWFCLLLVLLFIAVYLIDRTLHAGSDYLTTRRNVTGIVCASLLLAAFAMRSSSALSSAPVSMMTVTSQDHVRNAITAPSDP
jgi:phosphoglycerol transferase MdoB-like AlkP superfamily enzyme